MAHHLSSLVPMAYVKSVPRSIEFYEKLGFTVLNTFVPDGRSGIGIHGATRVFHSRI